MLTKLKKKIVLEYVFTYLCEITDQLVTKKITRELHGPLN